MKFGAIIYSAGGFFNVDGTVGAFNPAVDLVNDPNPPLGNGGRMLAPGFDDVAASGNIYSFDNFNGFPWEGSQDSLYLTNADNWAYVYDGVNCAAPGNVTKSTGTCSDLGSYDYDAQLAAMSNEQIAVGMFFNWNGSNGISVLDIFNCDNNSNCKGTGVAMQNGPFPGSQPQFNAGLTCQEGFAVIAIDEAVSFNIITDVLASDAVAPDKSNCVNPTSAPPRNNPPGLKVDNVISPTTRGGTVVINGTVIDYTPAGGFQGGDTFVINASDDTGDTTTITYTIQVGGSLQDNFSMLDAGGVVFGGTNDVTIAWDGVTFNTNESDNNFDNVAISSPEPFFDFNWSAHHIRVYEGPKTLSFDVTCTVGQLETGTADCGGGPTKQLVLDIPAGMVGVHINFDWNGTENIDVINVWQRNAVWDDFGDGNGKNALWLGKAGVTPGRDAIWGLVSIDADGDGVHGSKMIDGPFAGSYANFNYKPDRSGEPLPDFDKNIEPVNVDSFALNPLTLLAGLLSVFGIRRLKNK